jgi:hypothetical protein
LFGFSAKFDFQSDVVAVIATIQDPMHTRMSLGADRTLDSIQQAAYATGWEFASQWLPWNLKMSSRADDAEEQASEYELARETMPGLIVFRRHFSHKAPANYLDADYLDEILLVFVVGETPTVGINGFQFEAARHCVRAFQPETNRISVLGPNFSGSFSSLTKLIENDPRRSFTYDIQSGSVSNSAYAKSLLEDMERQCRKVEFHGASLPSKWIRNMFESQVLPDLGYGRERAAELVEDESGFSYGVTNPSAQPSYENAKNPSEESIITYRYPRDIAQLRNAYSDIAFANGAKPAEIPTSPLEFSLKDAQSGEDSFPIFSRTHTPVSQNAVLEQIVRELGRKKIRIVRLDATNVFDTIFLAKVLKKFCPDIRVVVSGADLLFVQEATDSGLAGLLAISTYPVFPEGREWANPGNRDITTFADADSISEYNAFISLLSRAHNNPNNIAEARERQPGEGDHHNSDRELNLFAKKQIRNTIHPNLLDGSEQGSRVHGWLLALGRNGWWPVDYLELPDNGEFSKTDGDWPKPDKDWFDRLPVSDSEQVHKPVDSQQPKGPALPVPTAWKLLALATAIVSLGFLGRICYLRLRPTSLVWSCFCSIDNISFRRFKQSQEATSANPGCPPKICDCQCICLLACLSSLALLPGVMLVPIIAKATLRPLLVTSGADYLLWSLVGFASLLLLLGAGFLLGWFVLHLFHRPTSMAVNDESDANVKEPGGRIYKFTVGTLVFLVVLFPLVILWLWRACCTHGVRGSLVCFRAMSLSPGISPIWPLLLCGIALFVAAFFHLKRFVWIGTQLPIVSTGIFDQALGGRFTRLTSALNRQLSSPISYGQQKVNVPVVCMALIASFSVGALLFAFVSLLSSTENLHSIEPRAFEYAMFGALLLLILATGLTFVQFFACWSTIRAFLATLNSLVLGQFFTKFPDFGGNGPVWFRRVPLLSLSASVNSAVALHNLQLAVRSSRNYRDEYWSALRTFMNTKVAIEGNGDQQSKLAKDKDRPQFVRDYHQFRVTAAKISDDLTERIIRPYWRKNALPFVGADPGDSGEPEKQALVEPERQTGRPSQEVLLLPDNNDELPWLALPHLLCQSAIVPIDKHPDT